MRRLRCWMQASPPPNKNANNNPHSKAGISNCGTAWEITDGRTVQDSPFWSVQPIGLARATSNPSGKFNPIFHAILCSEFQIPWLGFDRIFKSSRKLSISPPISPPISPEISPIVSPKIGPLEYFCPVKNCMCAAWDAASPKNSPPVSPPISPETRPIISPCFKSRLEIWKPSTGLI